MALPAKYFRIEWVTRKDDEVTFDLHFYLPWQLDEGKTVRCRLYLQGVCDVTTHLELPPLRELFKGEGIEISEENLKVLTDKFISSLKESISYASFPDLWDIFPISHLSKKEQFPRIGEVEVRLGSPSLSYAEVKSADVEEDGKIKVSIVYYLYCSVYLRWDSRKDYKEFFDDCEKLWREYFVKDEECKEHIKSCLNIKRETWETLSVEIFVRALKDALQTLEGIIPGSRLYGLYSRVDGWVRENLKLTELEKSEVTFHPDIHMETVKELKTGSLPSWKVTLRTSTEVFEQLRKMIMEGRWETAFNFVITGVATGIFQIEKSDYLTTEELLQMFWESIEKIQRETSK